MSKDFSRIKRALSMSTTLPAGSDGGPGWFGHGLAHSHHHDHHHHHDGCCGQDHGEEHHDHHPHEATPAEPAKPQAMAADEIEHEEDCDADHTSPRGGCGCC